MSHGKNDKDQARERRLGGVEGARKKMIFDKRTLAIFQPFGKIGKPPPPLFTSYPATPSYKSDPASSARDDGVEGDRQVGGEGEGVNKIPAGCAPCWRDADKSLPITRSVRQSRERLIIAHDERHDSPLDAHPPRGWYRSSLS